jgi:hypothetical protein
MFSNNYDHHHVTHSHQSISEAQQGAIKIDTKLKKNPMVYKIP